MVVTVDTFIVHLFRKVCSACLVKSWQTGNENFQIRRCLFGDWLKNELFYWVRVEEIFLMKIRPSPFHSPFRAYCSHKVDPHLRLCALRLHATATVCFFLDEILFLDTPVFQAPCIIVVVSSWSEKAESSDSHSLTEKNFS
ncbi:hypothetical protein T4E_8452 [Trichinella pseudospiralis]|uniref:Uncharacterized protein n=1 Tax=Trichinella pseudospiralis TaxID=6337 RepID=A0A0V0YE90_TRIPS|nr:hypothetical protein T4E_8452 [Trichinella pseudospiralis]